MDIFYVISNEQKDPGAETAQFIRSYLSEQGKTCYLRECSETAVPGQYRYTDVKQIPGEAECALVLGGDGTLLHAARDLVERRLPLLGVNMGTLGYLAEVERKNLPEVLDKLIADDFITEERMMLDGTAWHQNRKLMSDIALNDIVISRNGRMRVVDFNIYVDDVFLYSYAADGIIVSTPTGSTGYSLSAGGPIVEPASSMLLLTPVAPHTMNVRPIVLPDHAEVVVEIGSGHARDMDGAEAIFDGDTSVKLHSGDRVVISKAKQATRLIKIKNSSFLEILREKMNK